MLIIVGICVINLFISFINARNVGLIWCESKSIGGWVRILAWCGAVQSAVGFTSVYAVVAVFLAFQVGYFDAEDVRLFSNLIYVLIIVPAIGSGFYITLSSWLILARERSLRNLTVAGWNTFAQARNMYHAYNSFGPAIKDILSIFGGNSKSRRKNANVLLLVIFVSILGILTTTIIVMRYAGKLKIPEDVRSKFAAGNQEYQTIRST